MQLAIDLSGRSYAVTTPYYPKIQLSHQAAR